MVSFWNLTWEFLDVELGADDFQVDCWVQTVLHLLCVDSLEQVESLDHPSERNKILVETLEAVQSYIELAKIAVFCLPSNI